MNMFFDAAFKRVGYVLSLPERTIRSLAALAGGTTSLLTETLFPEALRGTTLYKIFVGDAQQFLIDKIAQVEREGSKVVDERATEQGVPGEDYLQRKMIGGTLETAGLFAMHFSPLWVFAIAGDAAGGSRVFLDRLAAHLKTNGVIDDDQPVNSLRELLEAIQDTSNRSATAIDTPPMSGEELGKLADELQLCYGQVFASANNLVPRIDQLWTNMQQVANRQNISIEKLSGILTVDAANWGAKGFGSVLAVSQTGYELFGEQILDNYAKTLTAVNEQGAAQYLANHLTPFVTAAGSHFSPSRTTWIEKMLGLGPSETAQAMAEAMVQSGPEQSTPGPSTPVEGVQPPEPGGSTSDPAERPSPGQNGPTI